MYRSRCSARWGTRASGPVLSLEERSGPSVPPGESRARAEPPSPPPSLPWRPQGRLLVPVLRSSLPKGPFPSWGARVSGAPGLSEGLGWGEPRPSSANGKGGRAGVGERAALRARGGREGGPGGGAGARGGARRVNPSAAGPTQAQPEPRAPERLLALGGGSWEPGALGRAERSAGDAAERGPRPGWGRCKDAVAVGGRAQASPRSRSRLRERTPRPGNQSGPRLCRLAAGVGPRSRRATRKPVLGRPAGVGGGPPGPPMGSGCRCEGHARAGERNTFHHHPQAEGWSEWGGAGGGGGSGGGPRFPESQWGVLQLCAAGKESVVAGDLTALDRGSQGPGLVLGGRGLGAKGAWG